MPRECSQFPYLYDYCVDEPVGRVDPEGIIALRLSLLAGLGRDVLDLEPEWSAGGQGWPPTPPRAAGPASGKIGPPGAQGPWALGNPFWWEATAGIGRGRYSLSASPISGSQPERMSVIWRAWRAEEMVNLDWGR